MQVRDMKQKSVDVHDFSMIPKAEIPRSSFRMEKNLKTTFDFSFLIPIMCEEVLPGDNWNCKITIVARTAVPIVPIMDNWHLETFAFFVPNRLVWTNWVKFMGEQTNPGDSISYTIPQLVSGADGFPAVSVYDYFGLPTAGQVTVGETVSVNALPLRGLNKIYNQWFRDENLQVTQVENMGDGPDSEGDYGLYERGKRKDYFTGCLPWPQKGNTPVTIPLGGTAPVYIPDTIVTGNSVKVGIIGTSDIRQIVSNTAGLGTTWGAIGSNTTDLFADLSAATAATINQLRQAFQIQKLLERDARGGTRYTEIIRAHFGVVSPDARLQRPEYIGGGRASIITNAIPQTAPTGLTGATTPMGTLAATGHVQGTNGFTYSATEHGYIIVLASARADLTYQQGLRKMWMRSTRYDFYFPVFAMLGEQAVTVKEIYTTGDPAIDNVVFGYQERWAEYRYNPSQVTGLFRSTSAGNIAYWHSAQEFATPPALNNEFIRDQSREVLSRNFAAGELAQGQQIIADMLFQMTVARPLPMYSVPGMIDHF